MSFRLEFDDATFYSGHFSTYIYGPCIIIRSSFREIVFALGSLTKFCMLPAVALGRVLLS